MDKLNTYKNNIFSPLGFDHTTYQSCVPCATNWALNHLLALGFYKSRNIARKMLIPLMLAKESAIIRPNNNLHLAIINYHRSVQVHFYLNVVWKSWVLERINLSTSSLLLHYFKGCPIIFVDPISHKWRGIKRERESARKIYFLISLKCNPLLSFANDYIISLK